MVKRASTLQAAPQPPAHQAQSPSLQFLQEPNKTRPPRSLALSSLSLPLSLSVVATAGRPPPARLHPIHQVPRSSSGPLPASTNYQI
ncbi:hypothetical protein U9M48_011801 [Paspalum notatum var. saurae]|uniref:Uncharacterized protein n=1 Tax=Paspalum notatum var. saurae TaxID=547442 RepID=A0AAQ3SX08_PASNO